MMAPQYIQMAENGAQIMMPAQVVSHDHSGQAVIQR
jgi:hypothetical protein